MNQITTNTLDYILAQNRGQADAETLKAVYAAATERGEKVKINSVDFENGLAEVELCPTYDIAQYAEEYKAAAVDNIVDFLEQRNISAADIEKLRDDAEENGKTFDLAYYISDKLNGDYYDLTDAALPDLFMNYEIMRIAAENYTEIDLDNIAAGNDGGDFICAVKYEISRAISDRVDDCEMLDAVILELQERENKGARNV